jgi:hypothetical protein
MRLYVMQRENYSNVTDLRLHGAKSSLPMCLYVTQNEIYSNVTDLRWSQVFTPHAPLCHAQGNILQCNRFKTTWSKSPFPMRPQSKYR